MNTNEAYNFDDATQGPISPPSQGTTQIIIRIDTATLNWFRKQEHQTGGGNYQTLINEALQTYVQSQEARREQTPKRRMVRKKFQAVLT